jgi:hypothetical protein
MSNTTNLQLSTPAHGSNVDTWSQDPVNLNSGIIDKAFGGVLSLTATSTTIGTANAQNAVLKFTGTISGNITATISGIIKSWTAINNTSGSFNVILATGSGKVIAVPPGAPTRVVSDGTDFYFEGLEVIGAYVDYIGSGLPSWVSACTVPPYLLGDGSSFSAVTYPVLAAILGGTTLPDCRGRARYALNGGTGRINVGVSGIDGNTRTSAGGAESVSIAQGNLPNYALPNTLGISDTRDWKAQQGNSPVGAVTNLAAAGSSGTGANIDVVVASGGISITGTIGSGGSGAALNKMPPAYIGGVTLIRAG